MLRVFISIHEDETFSFDESSLRFLRDIVVSLLLPKGRNETEGNDDGKSRFDWREMWKLCFFILAIPVLVGYDRRIPTLCFFDSVSRSDKKDERKPIGLLSQLVLRIIGVVIFPS